MVQETNASMTIVGNTRVLLRERKLQESKNTTTKAVLGSIMLLF
jgi:hypothetical protein